MDFFLQLVSPLALSATSFSKVTTVIDTALATSESLFAVHALAADRTLFLRGTEIAAYLRALEAQSGSETKIKELDFAALAAEAASGTGTSAGKSAKTESKPAAAAVPKDDGKIDGAAEVGILYKKDVNFPDWYTDVCLLFYRRYSVVFLKFLILVGSAKVGHVGLL